MHKYKIIILLVAIIAIAGIASAEVANTITSTSTQGIFQNGDDPQGEDRGMGEGVKPDKKGRLMRGGKEVVLTVASNGDTVLRGVTTAISDSTISVKTWGGIWTIDISKLPKGFQQNDASKVKVGDFVGVNGIMDKTTQIIVAKVIRVWDATKTPKDNASINGEDRKFGTSTNMMPPRQEREDGVSTIDSQGKPREGRLPPPRGMNGVANQN